MKGAAEAVPDWHGRRVVVALGLVAAVVALQAFLRPEWNRHSLPAALAVATLAVSVLTWRHGHRLDRFAAGTWRAFAVIAALLALGQLLRALTGVGVNPAHVGPSDLLLAATGPVAAYVCLRLVRSAGGRVRGQSVLDVAVALTALGALLQMLVPLTASRGSADLLLTVGYPAVSALLCGAGLVTLAGVSAPRRAAAAWLLTAFASLAGTMVSSALAAGRPSPLLDAVTCTAYLGVLAAGTLALAADPGPRARPEAPVAAVPLVGVVVSSCLGSGVLLLLLGSLVAGRPLVVAEAITVAALMLLTLLRTFVWAVDGARLTRHVLRTEAWFRALVDRAADVTLVLDGHGLVTWVGTASDGPSGLLPRDLEGRRLRDLVHPEDRHELHRALAPTPGSERGVVLRLPTRDGAWRQYETVRTAASAGPPGPGGRDGLVLHLRDVAGRRSAEVELERLAYTDYLTGLSNRARLMAELATARARAAAGEPSCLLLLDLDGFKPVNDVAGHEAGDELLVRVAARLRAGVRDQDLVGRLGGDEFAVLVPDGIDEATALAERIVADLHLVHAGGGLPGGLLLDVSASVGVTPIDPADDVATTVRQADLALRAAKAAGKNCVRTSAAAIDTALGRRARLARDLRAAIDQEQFRLVYQPVVGIEERRVLGLEALVRWDHPVLGIVPPDEFISLAEDDGLIVPLQQWVLRRATTDFAVLLAAGLDLKLGVNVSVRHLQAGCLAPDVAGALTAAGVPPQRLVLEVTESVMIDAEDRLAADLTTLREMGCIISLDDFGRGYSSLAYLARLPVDVLKMDREFVADIQTDPRGATLVATVVELGRTLGMDVVAEGVETTGQAAALAAMGCRFLQGWLTGRPMPADRLPAFLAGFDPTVLDDVTPDVDTCVHLVGQDG